MPETLYELLEVEPDALLSELRASYKRRMLAVHPDKGGTVERCQRVIAAFELLANPAARQLYDARLANCAPSRCHAKSKRKTSPRVARAAQAAGHCSPSRPEQPDGVGVAASSADKKARVFAADDLSGASARSDAGSGANSSNGDAFARGGCARNSYGAPSSKILSIMIRVVRLLRRLSRDARRDLIERNLSQAQRQAIEKFMLSEAQHAAASGSVKGDRIKQESGTHASSVSSDESSCSEDNRCDDEEEQLLALWNEPNECAEVEAVGTKDEEGAEKVETEEIGMEVGDSEDQKDENKEGEDDEQVDEREEASCEGEEDRSEDEEEHVLPLCNDASGCTEATACHACPVQFSWRTKVERARTWDREEEEKRDKKKQREHKEGSELERNEEESESGEAMSMRIADEAVGTKEEEGEKAETEEIEMEVRDSKDEKDEKEDGEDDEQVDEREEADYEGDAPATRRDQRRVAVAPRLAGITHEIVGKRPYYIAKIAFAWMCLIARRRRCLELALDDHILLVAIKARMTIWSPDSHGELTTPQRKFEDELQSAVPEVLEENGVDREQFGLSMYVSVPTDHWLGRSLKSPSYTLSSLDTALSVWRSFRDARGQLSVGGAGLIFRCSPVEATEIWGRVREVYLAAWAQRGANVSLLCEKLDALEAGNTESCRHKVERWERARMQREERLQRATVRALILAASRARREEKRERVAMRKEDTLRQHRLNLPVVDQIDRLLSLWVRELEKIQKRKARLQARESAAARQRSAAARHSAEKARLRAARVQREQRWRWLQRQDLTMEEILRGCPFEQ